MKMNPPASSSSPTSRKKPRIISHLLSFCCALLSTWHPGSRSARPSRNVRPKIDRRPTISLQAGIVPEVLRQEPRDARKRRNRLDRLLASSRAVREIQPHQNLNPAPE